MDFWDNCINHTQRRLELLRTLDGQEITNTFNTNAVFGLVYRITRNAETGREFLDLGQEIGLCEREIEQRYHQRQIGQSIKTMINVEAGTILYVKASSKDDALRIVEQSMIGHTYFYHVTLCSVAEVEWHKPTKTYKVIYHNIHLA